MFWLGAVVSLCYVPGVTGAFIATQWPVLAVLLPFGLLRSGPVTAFHVLGLLFLAYAALHMLHTPAFNAGVFGLWLVFIMALSVWFGTTLTETRPLYAGLALGGAVSSVLAVLQRFDFVTLPYTSHLPAGLYVNSVQQGTVLVLITVALLTERMWLWALPLLPGIALSGSRGAWLALAVGLLGLMTRRLWVFGLVAAAGAAFLLMPLSPSDETRLLIWSAAWRNLTWLGLGPGVFFVFAIPQDGARFFADHAHNDALQLVFEYGIGALLPFAVFAFALSRTGAKEWPIVLAFVAAGCYSMPLWMPVASFLALVAVGRILRGHAVACGYGGRSGLAFVPWRREASRGPVPVASHR